jgi:glycosyltransferase involved in cell wall biosynthesis
MGRYASSLIAALAAVPSLEIRVTVPPPPERETWNSRFLAARAGLTSALRGIRPDVVHSVTSEPLVGWPLQSQVVTLHDAIPWLSPPRDGTRRTHLEWQRRRLRQCGAVIAVSGAVARDAELVLGLEPSQVWTIPEGVGEAFSAAPRDDDHARRLAVGVHDDRYVLWVGSLRAHDPRKQLDHLLASMARLGHTAPLLVLAGAGGAESVRVAARARALRVRLQLAGHISDATLAALYRGACATLVCSSQEGFGLTALEAMACGTPLIASSIAALRELVDTAGLLVTVGDVDGLARAIATVTSDRELAERLSLAGRARAARFDWQSTASATAGVYREVARCVAPRHAAPPGGGPPAVARASSAATRSPTTRPGSQRLLS